MESISPRQKSLIVNSFKRVFSTGNIDHLTSSAYRYIYLASGFIAHYDLHGFRDAYRNVEDLKRNIKQNASNNMWGNFSPADRDYEYYQSKADVYRSILSLI
jgi:hypothetical protein